MNVKCVWNHAKQIYRAGYCPDIRCYNLSCNKIIYASKPPGICWYCHLVLYCADCCKFYHDSTEPQDGDKEDEEDEEDEDEEDEEEDEGNNEDSASEGNE